MLIKENQLKDVFEINSIPKTDNRGSFSRFFCKKTLSELNPLIDHPDWQTLKAVKNNKIFILDGNKYFNRSGLSIIPSILHIQKRLGQ